MLKKTLITVILAIVVILVVAVLWATALIRKGLPQTMGEITLSGLTKPVEVARDIYGIPHIKAESELDLYRALGFVNAQDRLWQLDLFRRLSQGRLAEVFGPNLFPLDHRSRVLGFQRLAKRLFANADENSKAICAAYVDGINQYIEEFPDRLPVEFRLLKHKPEKWWPEDVYAVLMWQQWQVTFNCESELATVALLQELGANKMLELMNIPKRLDPTIIFESEKQYAPKPSRIDDTIFAPEMDYAQIRFGSGESLKPENREQQSALLEPQSEMIASNCWVISGARSASGKPILCNDPHISHTLPSIWYMVHLSAPGIDDAAGIMTPGVPMVVMGHTRHVAWGDTTTMADTQDLYLEKLNPENPLEYLYNGEYRQFEVINETIRYRESGRMKAVEKQILLSAHGPIINEIVDPPVLPDTPLALRWSGYELSDSIKGASLALKARNCVEFRQALSNMATPVWNWVLADADGNIGYQLVGFIPIRKKGKGMVPVPGWLKDYEWDGYIPYEEMPRLLNPSCGYIVTANNRVTPADYPYLIAARFEVPYRANRIKELILSREKFSAEDMRRTQMDMYSGQGARLRDRFVAACERYPQPDADFKDAVEILRTWDLNADAESAGASVCYESHARLARKMVSYSLKPEFWKQAYEYSDIFDDMLEQESAEKWFDHPLTEKVETRDEAIAASVAEACRSLREFFHDEPANWKWGRLHTLTFVHPLGQSGLLAKALNRGPFPLGGTSSTINMAFYLPDTGRKPYAVIAGPSMRTVVDFGEVDGARMVITLGQSEERASRHYSDQLPFWLKGESLPMWNGPNEINTNLEGRLVLRP
ncbi:MAG: penicillin acylase family protein [Candidatus Lindowbacteria bacterium]|nr:penicillin acylase family protein [Candidatus Lindowbacteria bacterium]